MNTTSNTLATSELLILPLQAGAPAVVSETFPVAAGGTTVHRIRHDDGVGTLFLEISFPPGSIVSGPGGTVADQDTVQVTIQASSGLYRFNVSPRTLEFDSRNAPSVTVSFARYSDFQIVNGSSYATEDALANALTLWYETAPGLWSVARGSRDSGTDELTAFVDKPGNYLLAAPR